jgi:predicted phosphodiesterase
MKFQALAMQFAAIADIHGNLPALEAVFADISRRGVTAIVNLGDLLSGPLWPVETANRLEPLRLPTIRGNHERQLLTLSRPNMGPSDQYTIDHLTRDHLDWLSSLRATMRFAADVFLCHGTPQDDLTYFLHEVRADGTVGEAAPEAIREQANDAALTLCGHTHVPGSVRLPDGRLIVNPGSVGLPAYTDDSPYPHVMQSGTPHARYAILTRAGSVWGVEQIAVEYDWEAAARQAAHNRRADWAEALRTGRLTWPLAKP